MCGYLPAVQYTWLFSKKCCSKLLHHWCICQRFTGFIHVRGLIIWGSSFSRDELLFWLDNKLLSSRTELLYFLYSSQHLLRCPRHWRLINTIGMDLVEQVTTWKWPTHTGGEVQGDLCLFLIHSLLVLKILNHFKYTESYCFNILQVGGIYYKQGG